MKKSSLFVMDQKRGHIRQEGGEGSRYIRKGGTISSRSFSRRQARRGGGPIHFCQKELRKGEGTCKEKKKGKESLSFLGGSFSIRLRIVGRGGEIRPSHRRGEGERRGKKTFRGGEKGCEERAKGIGALTGAGKERGRIKPEGVKFWRKTKTAEDENREETFLMRQ